VPEPSFIQFEASPFKVRLVKIDQKKKVPAKLTILFSSTG